MANSALLWDLFYILLEYLLCSTLGLIFAMTCFLLVCVYYLKYSLACVILADFSCCSLAVLSSEKCNAEIKIPHFFCLEGVLF